jgi:hypothetical protein
MVLEERMVERRLFGDMYTIYDISIRALLILRISGCIEKRSEDYT